MQFIDTQFVLFFAGSIIFQFWPLLLLSPLNWREKFNFPETFIAIWAFLAMIRFLLLFSPTELVQFFPEPLYSFLFVLAGITLGAVSGIKRYRMKHKLHKTGKSAQSPVDLLELSPQQFEDMVVDLYQTYGHRAWRTSQIGDHGVDIIIEAKNGERWIAQCKRWRSSVGEPVIRDFYGTMHHEKAAKGALITSGTFTPQAREWANGKPIFLYDGEEFLTAWRRSKKKPPADIATNPKKTNY